MFLKETQRQIRRRRISFWGLMLFSLPNTKENPPEAEKDWNCVIFLKETQRGIRRRREIYEIWTFALMKHKGKSAGGGKFEILTFPSGKHEGNLRIPRQALVNFGRRPACRPAKKTKIKEIAFVFIFPIRFYFFCSGLYCDYIKH